MAEIRQRGLAKGKLTRIETFINLSPLESGTTIGQYETKLVMLEAAFQEFNLYHNEITKTLTDTTEEEQLEYYLPVEELYFQSKSTLQTFITARTLECQSESMVNNLNQSLMNQSLINQSNILGTPSKMEIKLPRLSLPIFSGDYKEWNSFSDLFSCTVHKNSQLTNVQKLQYLKSVVKGEALQLIQHFNITSDNYEEAWDKLEARFNKKKHIVYHHIKNFMNLPTTSQPNSQQIREITSSSDAILRAFKALDYNERDPWIIYMILQKLDSETQSLWSHESAGNDTPTEADLFKFLEKRCDALESISPKIIQSSKQITSKTLRIHHTQSSPANIPSTPTNIHSFFQTSTTECPVCTGKYHFLYHCPTFKEWDIASRRIFVNKNNCCYNCLLTTHTVSSCKSKYSCHECKKRHHTLLHIPANKQHQSNQQQSPSTSQQTHNKPKMSDNSTKSTQPTNNSESSPSSTIQSYTTTHNTKKTVGILPTAVINALDGSGNLQQVRVLFDSASQDSLITEDCVQRLQLSRQNARYALKGTNNSKGGVTRGVSQVQISSRFNSNTTINLEVFILNDLTSLLPPAQLKIPDLNILNSIQLADPEFDTPGKIDIMIGTDHVMELLRPGLIQTPAGHPIITNTVFGWIVSGKIPCNPIPTEDIRSYHTTVDHDLQKFWEIEEVIPITTSTQEELRCIQHFESTYQRNDSGRFIVRLPFKENAVPLGESVYQAISRLSSMERRFKFDTQFMTEYHKFMDEILSLEHMEKIPSDQIDIGNYYYLPHHAVFKESSTTTKLRVVFDASCKTKSGNSLNDNLMVGPTIQDDLFTTVLRFRSFKYAFTADITKMYRQILMHPKDSNFQRIIWRKSSDEPYDHYRLTTVAYGTASAPFLATKTLQKLGQENEEKFPEAAHIIQNHFYVDDLMSGGDNLEVSLRLQGEIIQILQSAGLELRKWASNHKDLLSNIPRHQQELNSVNLPEESQAIKTLGLNWNPINDFFYFQVHLQPVSKITKRHILSDVSRLFDPLGLLSPALIPAKIIFQELWLLKLNWDDEIPTPLCTKWTKFRDELHKLQDIKVPRWIPNNDRKVELHGFCDSSTLAYGASIYARCLEDTGEFSVNIITSKTKVAPLKELTIPRLELCGATLLCRLMNKVKKALEHLDITDVFLWTDSTIVLAYLSSPPRRWQTFVSNRCSEVIESFPIKHWNHIRSKDNPADIASRGIPAGELITDKLWWNGPAFLQIQQSDWPAQNYTPRTDCPEEKKLKILAHTTQIQDEKLDLINKYSSLQRLLRITAYLLRFIHNCRTVQKDRQYSFLTTSEIADAMTIYVKEAQQEAFAEEIKTLENYQPISNKSKLASLHPFLNINGVLRVDGRLQHSNLSYSSKHQIILPPNHPFTTLLVRTKHIQLLHANFTLLSSTLLQDFWIIGQRNLIKQTIRKCIICFRFKAQTSAQLMGNLPKARITPSKPFSHVGCDYAGPIPIKLNKRRNSSTDKGYIALFICLATKALHLEAVSSLTSDAFIAALKRFASRRGHPTDVYSDNGTNFVGANRKLGENFNMFRNTDFNDKISHFLTSHGTNWHFNPPSAPHFGGLWEAGVKSVKFHLKRSFLNTMLTFEELTTALATIEACLNSRPLMTISNDPQNPKALTPAHFLVGQELTSIPEPSADHAIMNRLDRWKFTQKLTTDFWKRWSREYLTTLQSRNKWRQDSPNLKCNDLVLVKEDNVPPSQWIMAVVTNVHPGSDNKIRVVTLQNKNKMFQRPIHKLCLLPIE